MRYRFFLFKSSLYDKGIVTTLQINALAKALSSYQLDQIRVFQCIDYDLEKPMYDLYYTLGDKAQANMQAITQRHSSGCWIGVTTDFPHAEEVYPIVSKTAKDHGLLVYDAEKRQFTTDAAADKTFIQMRMSGFRQIQAIRRELRSFWRIQEVPLPDPIRFSFSAFVVTILKNPTLSFERRIQLFYECLERHLNSDEELTGKDKGFLITDGNYSVTFVLEGYKKYANMIGYPEDRQLRTDLLRRMNGYEAFKRFENNPEWAKGEITERMGDRERIEKYPNPVDRFVSIVKEYGLH